MLDTYAENKNEAILYGNNEKQVWHTLYDDHDEVKYNVVKYKFNIGDKVRISKIKRMFQKGYLPNFSKEIFTVSKQIPRDPPVYKLKDYNSEELKGTLPSNASSDVFPDNKMTSYFLSKHLVHFTKRV